MTQKHSSREERDTINEALTTDDRDLFNQILNRPDMTISYEKQIVLLDWISVYQPDLAIKIFQGGTPIQLGLVQQASSAFRSNNEIMAVFLMQQDELQKKETRTEIFQDAITNGSPLVRIFVEEIIFLYLENKDQKLKTPLIPEMDDIQICFDFLPQIMV